jgi:hypothetical protein
VGRPLAGFIEVNVMTTDITTSAVELVLALDEETLRAEFDALIDSVWADDPPQRRQSGAFVRDSRVPADRAGYTTTDDSGAGLAKTEERERSPPRASRAPQNGSEVGDAYRKR